MSDISRYSEGSFSLYPDKDGAWVLHYEHIANVERLEYALETMANLHKVQVSAVVDLATKAEGKVEELACKLANKCEVAGELLGEVEKLKAENRWLIKEFASTILCEWGGRSLHHVIKGIKKRMKEADGYE